MDKSLPEFEKEVTCFICEAFYTEPKVLPCHHYFCERCISLTSASKCLLSCPLCHKETETSTTQDLPTAHFIQLLVQRFFLLFKAHSGHVFCEECKWKRSGKAFCLDCNKIICWTCVCRHSWFVRFKGHRVISMTDIRGMDVSELISDMATGKRCPIHGALLVSFCRQCDVAVCCECEHGFHYNHELYAIEAMAEENRERQLAMLPPLTE